jgi:hypothetical protein
MARKAAFAVKRRNPRFSLMAAAEVMGPPDEMPTPAQLSELSSRGCYVDTVNPVPIGTELRLRIHYGSGTCDLHGKVIYAHTGNGMGVSGIGVLFGKMAPDQRSAIDAWLVELATEPASSTL